MPTLKEEQALAVNFNEGDILVSASAGSGKTFVMIERLIRLITEGKASVKQMLAVTFTEASAADMKEKLKKALTDKILQGNDALSDQLLEVASADICTIHAFCARLLRQYFFSVGIAPDFKICDEEQAAVIKAESMDKTFKELYAQKSQGFYSLLDRYRYKRSNARLIEYILSAYNYMDSEKSPQEFVQKTLNNYTQAGFDFLKGEYKRYLNKSLQSVKERLTRCAQEFELLECAAAQGFCNAVIEDLTPLLTADLYAVKAFGEYKRRADFGRRLSAPALQVKGVATTAFEELKGVIARFNKYLTTEQEDRLAFESLKEHTLNFLTVVGQFADNYKRAKREENLLDFGDLEHLTLQALQDERVLGAVKQKYKYIFIDEYQDVNGVQEEIASKLSTDNLFMVGDLKQSIYGFRGCRPEIFAQKFDRMTELGQKTLLLNYNFRSAPAVLEGVNQIFSYSMTKEWAGLDYKATSMLKSGGVYPREAEGRCQLHLLKKQSQPRAEKPEPKLYDILEQMRLTCEEPSAKIASLITAIVGEELGKSYYNPKEGAFKRVTFSDIAVLTRNRDNAYIRRLVAGLQSHNLPVSSEVKENVCDFPEIITLINALKLIDNFRQDIPLVSTLKSPIGGFTEEELAEIALFYHDNYNPPFGKRRGGFTKAFFYYVQNADTPLKARLVSFCAYIEGVRAVADFTGAKGALDKLIKDSDYQSCLLCSDGGEIKEKRLNGFISATYSGGKRLTVREFLKKTVTAKEAFSVSSATKEDSITVMTIHASKGLEFPVVIVCGLERAMNAKDESGELIADRELGFALRRFDDDDKRVTESLLRGVIREKKIENRIKEELRLFYVATTRAAYSLHLTFEGKEDTRTDEFFGASRFIDYIPLSMPVRVWEDEHLALVDTVKGRRKVLVGRPNEEAERVISQNLAFEYPNIADTTLPLKNTVTSALQEKTQDFYLTYSLFDEECPDKEKGIIAHKIMELLDFSRLNEFDLQLKEMASTGALSAEALGRVNTERIKRALSDASLNALADYALYREKDFLCEVEGNRVFATQSSKTVLMQGVIDLLAIKGNVGVVVDYKYSALMPDSLKKKYQNQLELYSYAVEKLLGVRVEKKLIINLFTGETVIL